MELTSLIIMAKKNCNKDDGAKLTRIMMIKVITMKKK